MQSVPTYQKCQQCNGTGLVLTSGGTDQQQIVCNWPGCADGYIEIGSTELEPGLDDILDKVNDVLDKCNDILDALA